MFRFVFGPEFVMSFIVHIVAILSLRKRMLCMLYSRLMSLFVCRPYPLAYSSVSFYLCHGLVCDLQ